MNLPMSAWGGLSLFFAVFAALWFVFVFSVDPDMFDAAKPMRVQTWGGPWIGVAMAAALSVAGLASGIVAMFDCEKSHRATIVGISLSGAEAIALIAVVAAS